MPKLIILIILLLSTFCSAQSPDDHVVYPDTSLVIGEIHGKKIMMTKVFNPILRMMFGIGVVNKVFGNLVYEKSMSDYDKANYRIRDFRESIELTEK